MYVCMCVCTSLPVNLNPKRKEKRRERDYIYCVVLAVQYSSNLYVIAASDYSFFMIRGIYMVYV